MGDRNVKAFWMVWNPARSIPAFRHSSRLAANLEATRLARENPGQEFFVLEALARVQRVDVVVEPLEGGSVPPDNGIPF